MGNLKVHTIWKFGIIFGTSRTDIISKARPKGELYLGTILDMPFDLADQIAEIHPKFNTHFQHNKTTWYKGYGYLSGGTEDPIAAISSRRDKRETDSNKDYVLIWKI